jgi:hypothetical protein
MMTWLTAGEEIPQGVPVSIRIMEAPIMHRCRFGAIAIAGLPVEMS